MATARKPARRLMVAGNWKMNLNHLEAIALTQKLAFSLSRRPSWTRSRWSCCRRSPTVRSVQTLVDGDHLLLRLRRPGPLGAHDNGAFTGDISRSRCSPSSGARTCSSGHSERRAAPRRGRRDRWPPRSPPRSAHGTDADPLRGGGARGAAGRRDQVGALHARSWSAALSGAPGRAGPARWSWPTNRSGRSGPAGSRVAAGRPGGLRRAAGPARRAATAPRSPARCGSSTADR